jgi:hypothetical protein
MVLHFNGLDDGVEFGADRALASPTLKGSRAREASLWAPA